MEVTRLFKPVRDLDACRLNVAAFTHMAEVYGYIYGSIKEIYSAFMHV